MIFFLTAFDGSGTDLGRISIFINPPGAGVPEGHGWEWQGTGINTGGSYQWSHNGSSYFMQLLEGGSGFGSLSCPGWAMPPNSNGEPPRPWFSSQGNNAGIGSVSPGSPAQLLAGFNWRLI